MSPQLAWRDAGSTRIAGCTSQSSSVAMTAKVPVMQMKAINRLSFNPAQLCTENHHFRLKALADATAERGLVEAEAAFILAPDDWPPANVQGPYQVHRPRRK